MNLLPCKYKLWCEADGADKNTVHHLNPSFVFHDERPAHEGH